MSDYLKLLKDKDKKARRERKRVAAEKAAAQAEQREWEASWDSLFVACARGDHEPGSTPDLSAFVVVAKMLKRHGFLDWLPEMAANLASTLGDPKMYREGALFIVQLLITAGKPRVTLKRLARDYGSFQPDSPPLDWRERGARDASYFVDMRLETFNKENEQRRLHQIFMAPENRKETLRSAAAKRPTITKQLFAVHWNDQGLGPAAIRDKWNRSRPEESVGGGDPGREDIKMAIRRGREFLAQNETDSTEVVSLLGISVGN